MIPMIFDDRVRAEIARVKAYADTHRTDHATLLRLIAEQKEPVGANPEHRLIVPLAYAAVYSIEQQPEPAGWCHHLSVSCAAAGRVPNEHAMLMLAQAFGVDITSLAGVVVWVEGKELPAINLLVPFSICQTKPKP